MSDDPLSELDEREPVSRFGPMPPPPDYSPLVLTPGEQAEEDQWYAAFRTGWEQAEVNFEIEMAELDARAAEYEAQYAEFEARMAAERKAVEPTVEGGGGPRKTIARIPLTPEEYRRRLDEALATNTDMVCPMCGRSYRPTESITRCPRCAIYWNRQPPKTGRERQHTQAPDPQE